MVASETRTKRLHENGRLLCIRREHTESSSLLQQALSLRKTSPTIKYFGLIPRRTLNVEIMSTQFGTDYCFFIP